MESNKIKVQVSKRGPYIINGSLSIILPDGTIEERSGVVALCRCGGSLKKPFCDGTHTNIGFQG
jgi:CDGSH-type Zn-finger protein